MEAPSFRRYYSRIKKLVKRVSKQAVLSLVFLFILLGNVAPTLADNTFDEYKYLFHTADTPSEINVGVNTNTFNKKAWIVDGQNIPGILLNFSYKFGTEKGEKNAEYSWDHIDADSGNNIFIIRTCDTGTTNNCLFSSIPYAQYEYGSTTTIFRRRGNFYYNQETVDITANDWTTLDRESASPDFLQKPTQDVSIWYCGSQPSNDVIPGGNQIVDPKNAASTANDPDIQKFDDRCGGNSYFKINQISVTQPTSAQQEAQTFATATANTSSISGGAFGSQVEKPNGNIPGCSVLNGALGTSGSWTGCLAQLAYFLIYKPIEWVTGVLGNLFDFFLNYSLSDSSYRADFAVRGWQLVRDISNIFFIIILVWTGLSTVFKTGTNMKRVVPNLILNALLINFSLFATRVVIDISNITARVFYNSIHVCTGPCTDNNGDGKADNPRVGITGSKPLSEAIVSSFNPQKMFDTSILSPQNAVDATGETQLQNGTAIDAGGTKNLDVDSNEYAGYFLIVSLIAAFMMFGVGMMFWKTAFFFLGRVIGLFVAMIFAPFAFLSRGNIPLVSSIKDLSWDSWVKDLTKYALLAPIFVFFLYIIYSFLQSNFLKITVIDLHGGFIGNVLHIIIPLLIVYFMVKQGVDIAKAYAGKIGEAVQKGAQKVIGFAGGAALGGTALLGGRVLGGAASALNKSTVGARLRDAAPNSWFARKTLGGLNKASAGSYDIRQTNIGKSLFKEMGVNTDQKGLDTLKGVGLGLSTAQRKGGFESDVKRRQEDRERSAKLFEEKMPDEKSKEYIKKYNEKQKQKYESKLDEVVDSAIAARTGKTSQDVEIMKGTNRTAYDAEKTAVMADQKTKDIINKIPVVKEVKNSAELTAVRRATYAENLKKPNLIDRTVGAVPLVGNIIGSEVRKEGDKKAAKKIEETTKVEKELAEIENTLKKGFQNLVALDMFQGSASFDKLSTTEQQEIIKDGSIQTGNHKGQGMYDILTQAEKDQVDQRRKELDKKENKDDREEYEDLVKARESNKYDLKDLRQKMKKAQESWVKNPKDDKKRTDYRNTLKEVKKAEKHQDKFRDLNNYIKSRREKLKGEEKK